MTEPYRTSAFACPLCGGPRLREFGDRVVCDDCHGMLIGEHDFALAVQELDGAEHPIVATALEPGSTPCPVCSRPMELCTLRVGTHVIEGRFARCAQHGVFLPQDIMTAVFARASRRGRAGRGGGRSHVGASTVRHGGGGVGAAMGSIASAFGGGRLPAASLAISQWKSTRPTVHTVYVSAFKDRPLPCPACGTDRMLEYQGDRWSCPTCAGTFVETAAFTAMASEMTTGPWELPAATGAVGARLCPQCATPMTTERLDEVDIDRCAAHGVWFDERELEASLHHIASPSSTGLAGWLRALFT